MNCHSLGCSISKIYWGSSEILWRYFRDVSGVFFRFHAFVFLLAKKNIYIGLETKSCRILPLAYVTKYDMT